MSLTDCTERQGPRQDALSRRRLLGFIPGAAAALVGVAAEAGEPTGRGWESRLPTEGLEQSPTAPGSRRRTLTEVLAEAVFLADAEHLRRGQSPEWMPPARILRELGERIGYLRRLAKDFALDYRRELKITGRATLADIRGLLLWFDDGISPFFQAPGGGPIMIVRRPHLGAQDEEVCPIMAGGGQAGTESERILRLIAYSHLSAPALIGVPPRFVGGDPSLPECYARAEESALRPAVETFCRVLRDGR